MPDDEPDGGPVWGPSTYLIVEGLRACGEDELAETIADRFCRTCAENGFAENFDALTGEGLRDRAYSWTASVFLLLQGA
ncbi:MAG: MGH1-like glycoside hydrolase domain-containing protein [Spirochaetales bacterium]